MKRSSDAAMRASRTRRHRTSSAAKRRRPRESIRSRKEKTGQPALQASCARRTMQNIGGRTDHPEPPGGEAKEIGRKTTKTDSPAPIPAGQEVRSVAACQHRGRDDETNAAPPSGDAGETTPAACSAPKVEPPRKARERFCQGNRRHAAAPPQGLKAQAAEREMHSEKERCARGPATSTAAEDKRRRTPGRPPGRRRLTAA